MWRVDYWMLPKTMTYDGKGASSRWQWRLFDDQASARRFAQNIVEAGPAWMASGPEWIEADGTR